MGKARRSIRSTISLARSASSMQPVNRKPAANLCQLSNNSSTRVSRSSDVSSERVAELVGARGRVDQRRLEAQDGARRQASARPQRSFGAHSHAAHSRGDGRLDSGALLQGHARADERLRRTPPFRHRRPREPAPRGFAFLPDRSFGHRCDNLGRSARARSTPVRHRAQRRRGSGPSSSSPLSADTRLEVAFDRSQRPGRQISPGLHRNSRLATTTANTHVGASLPDHLAAIPP